MQSTRIASCILMLGLAAIAMTSVARARDGYRVLYAFQGGRDGQNPYAGVVADSAGNLYGSTTAGGDPDCIPNLGDCGTIFKIARDGSALVLHTFSGLAGNDGAFPSSLAIDAKGNLYGTTMSGGSPGCQSNFGCGTIFKITPDGKETILYAFLGSANPDSGVTLDKAGNIYGMLPSGGGDGCGGAGCGQIFKLTPAGAFNTFYSFSGDADGQYPSGELLRDSAGNFYGTTREGGSQACGVSEGCGTVFSLSPNGKESVLHIFGDGKDGYYPQAPLAMDKIGNIYGVTIRGGPEGQGAIFKIAADGTETTLHAFKDKANDMAPFYGLTLDSAGNPLWASLFGGNGCAPYGCGRILHLSADGTPSPLHVFHNPAKGQAPLGKLLSRHGKLYGTTITGGVKGGARGYGVVFEVIAQ